MSAVRSLADYNEHLDMHLAKLRQFILEKALPEYTFDDTFRGLHDIVLRNADGSVDDEPHKTVQMIDYRGTVCEIDEMIAPLIGLIWQHGLHTNNSCQDNVPHGYIWIAFDTSNHLKTFLKLIFKGENSARFNEWKTSMSTCPIIVGEYSEANLANDSDTELTPEELLICDFHVCCSVRFQQSDLVFVQSKFCDFENV